MRLQLENGNYIDTEKPIDISMSLKNTASNPRAWYVDSPQFEPVMSGQFIGSVAKGGSVNFRDVFFNPHGHGTHTECVGHISNEWININDCLKTFWFNAQLITVKPEAYWNEVFQENDLRVALEQLESIGIANCEALIVRTLPNLPSKQEKYYSGTNPAYFDVRIVHLLETKGIQHLLVDLPSVDRENDKGELAFHHAFWNYPKQPQLHKTITELIYVDNSIPDGTYVLNLQFAPFNNDASPARPVLYEIR